MKIGRLGPAPWAFCPRCEAFWPCMWFWGDGEPGSTWPRLCVGCGQALEPRPRPGYPADAAGPL